MSYRSPFTFISGITAFVIVSLVPSNACAETRPSNPIVWSDGQDVIVQDHGRNFFSARPLESIETSEEVSNYEPRYAAIDTSEAGESGLGSLDSKLLDELISEVEKEKRGERQSDL